LGIILNGWGARELNAGRYERASRVLAAGLRGLPADRDLWWNYTAVAFDTGDDRAVVARAGQAGEHLPEAAEFDSAAAFYARVAFRVAGRGNWQGGLGVLARGLKAVPAEQRKW